MPTSYTSLIGLALPVTGELAGVWGDTVNNYITNYLDSAVAGTQTISGSQTAVTLSVTNGSSLVTAGSGATGSAQFQIINCTGNPAGLLTITAPASSRQYIIINATSTSQSVKIVGTGPTTGVTILSGEKAHVAWNGSDFVKIATQSGNGSFVDLTVSGSMTLSGGTANGVLYLNGSKVATSGSALTFDGTNFATTGTATATRFIPSGSTVATNGLYLPAANSIGISTNSTNAIYIDSSQNVGIGVTPSAWSGGNGVIEFVRGGHISNEGGSTLYIGNNFYYNGTNYIYKTTQGASVYGVGQGSHVWYNAPSGTANTTTITNGVSYTIITSGNQTAFGAANNNVGTVFTATSSGTLSSGTVSQNISFTQAMTLDSSGNFYVGTTSQSGGSNITFNQPANADMKIAASVSTGTRAAYQVFVNTTVTTVGTENSTGGSLATGTSAYATVLANSGAYPISFATNNTERARINSSGNFVIGSTTANGRLTVVGGSDVAGHFSSSSGTGQQAIAIFNNTTNSGYLAIAGVGTSSSVPTWSDGSMVSEAVPFSTGNYIISAYSGNLIFQTNGRTNQARITSGGNLLVGTTTDLSSSYAYQVGSARSGGFYSEANGTGDAGFASVSNAILYHFYGGSTTQSKFYVENDGDAFNRNGTYGTISDIKHKQDVIDAPSQWDDLKAIRFRKYRMKSDVQTNPDAPYLLGVVAQELEQVSPGLVSEDPDFETKEVTDEDGNVTTKKVQVGITKTVKSSILLMKAAVALQEAMTRIEQLEAKVAALESKGA